MLSTVRIIVIGVLLNVGLLTCVISHYKMGARSWSERRGRPPPQVPQPQQKVYLPAPHHSVLFRRHGLLDKNRLELAAQKERHIRQQSVQTDLALDLPASVTLPDGEEYPYGSSKLLHLRNPQQESEIYRGCIRPPPNRTVLQGDGLETPLSNPVSFSSKPCSPASVLRTIDRNPLVIPRQNVSGGNHHQDSGGLSQVYCRIPVPTCGKTTRRRASSTGEKECQRQMTLEAAEPPPRFSDIIQTHDLCRFSGQSGV
ncbi:low-density lipoprotein receptor class A domain-containing protein 4-like isoform X2 [Tachypleus tridentatus]|uniref:low-density lipoprotein receptor class A domain-containing protein 4-like isoform X2 n=1 Tax=Tachypleus tridentatus TaxID=6853 RepID=UPI003FD36FA3